jgi:hypothetical protein
MYVASPARSPRSIERPAWRHCDRNRRVARGPTMGLCTSETFSSNWGMPLLREGTSAGQELRPR